jgi:DNA modification methylase
MGGWRCALAQRMKPEQWPASKVELRPLEKIIPYPKNPRTHPPEQIELLARLMREEGVTAPILVDEEGVIIYGHGRHLAATQNGFKKYPVVIATGWSEQKKRAARIQDNQVALLSGWDSTLIGGELAELKASGFDIPLLGFPEFQLAGWGIVSGTEGQQSAESVPEPSENPIPLLGDLWILGNHRLLCGDSTRDSDVKRLMDGGVAKLFATDPPYAVGYSGGSHPKTKANRGAANRNKNWVEYKEAGLGEGERDDDKGAEIFYAAFVKAAVDNAIDQRAPWYCWHASRRQAMVEKVWIAAGAFVHQQIIWVKSRGVLTYSHYLWQHEPCLFGWIKGKRPKSNRIVGGTLSTIWDVPNAEIDSTEHPTSKPTKLFRIPMEQHTANGDICYEPFSGSGSQIIAAEMTSRRCFALEVSPTFVQVAIERWQNFTGRRATLDGKTFTEVQRERQKRGRRKAAPVSAEATV